MKFFQNKKNVLLSIVGALLLTWGLVYTNCGNLKNTSELSPQQNQGTVTSKTNALVAADAQVADAKVEKLDPLDPPEFQKYFESRVADITKKTILADSDPKAAEQNTNNEVPQDPSDVQNWICSVDNQISTSVCDVALGYCQDNCTGGNNRKCMDECAEACSRCYRGAQKKCTRSGGEMKPQASAQAGQ